MIESYGKYQDTGIEFIGSVPENWGAKRIKFGVNSLTGFAFKSNEYKDKGIKIARGINVKEAVLNWDDTKYWDEITPALKRYFLMPGDVLIQMDGSKVGKNYCIIREEDLPILLVQRVTRLRTKKTLNSKFLFYTIACQNFFNWVSISKTDPLVPHITLKDIENYAIALPPITEQIEIAKYLDNKTQAIDKKVNLLTKKADNYKELRKSIINDAVCKGLDRNVKLKESGIEWIGKIPEHWEVKRLKDVVLMNRKTLDENTTPTYQFKYIDIGNVGGTGSLENIEIVDFENAPSRARRIVKKGDVIVSTVRTYLKAIATINFEANDVVVSTGFAVLTSKPNVEAKFVGYFVQSDLFVDRVIKYSSGVSYPAINATTLSVIEFLKPPLSQQTAIANYLDDKTKKIDAIVSNIGKQIETLKELRKTLINDVITGKIKVTL